MNYIDLSPYNLPIFVFSVAMIFTVLILNYNESLIVNNLKINKNRFVTPKAKWIYLMSFKVPFAWFVEDDNNLTKRGVKTQQQLKKVGLDDFFTTRSWMALKVFAFVASLFAILIISTFMANLHIVFELMFGIQDVEPLSVSLSYAYPVTSNITIYPIALDMKIAGVLLMLSMYPNFYLKGQLNKLKVAYNKDIPILQMFVILMLRSKKTIGEIIYGLSKIDTPHSNSFKTSHRIYIRSHNAGLEHLKEYFDGHRFGDTFALMEELDLYSREDTIDIMQSNLVHIIEDIKLDKQKNASSKIIYSQASMIIPFMAVILLGMVPIIYFGISQLNSAMI